jgi:transposase
MLHHDNAPPHASLLIREFLAKQETIVMPQPSYSPDLAPAEFFLFPKLKSTLKGRRFQMVEEKRKFATGPSRHPAKHVPGRVPELGKKL